MDVLKIEKCEPLEIPKSVKVKTIFGFKKFKKKTKPIKEDKTFEKILLIDEVLDQDE